MSAAISVSKALTLEDANKLVSGSSLKDKSILVTGGASGLGAATGALYAEKGAYVTLADINEELGKSVAADLQAKGLKVQFVTTDVTNWASQIAAFKAAIAFSPSKATVDIVLAAAGVFGAPFLAADDPVVTLDSDPSPPDDRAIQVNTIGILYTARLAQLYFTMPSATPSSTPKSLIMVASLAAYFDVPNIAAYSGSKHGARGLFRILRPLFAARGIRVNLLAPWVLETPMTTELVPLFKAAGAPLGDKEDFYKIALRLADDSAVNGRAFGVVPSKRVLDLGDDLEGEFAGKAMTAFHKDDMPDWDEMAAKMCAIMQI